MYANGLINYEISSVGYVRLLKGSTAGWSILLLCRCCSLSHSLAISFSLGLAYVGQLWAANEPITTTTTAVAAATHYACCNRKHLPLANLHFDISNVNLHINLAQTVGHSVTHSVSQSVSLLVTCAVRQSVHPSFNQVFIRCSTHCHKIVIAQLPTNA